MRKGIQHQVLQRIAANQQRLVQVYERDALEREAIRRLNTTQKLDSASKGGDG